MVNRTAAVSDCANRAFAPRDNHCGTRTWIATASLTFATMAAPELVSADEGGVSFWLPGEFGSFAAVPGEPGLSVASFYLQSRGERQRE
jgi:hypothetical protein